MAKNIKTNAAPAAPTAAMEVKAKISHINPEGNPKATLSLSLNDAFVIRGAKLMESGSGELFAAMPAYRQSNGKYQDICYPLSKELRDEINRVAINVYNQALSQLQGQNAAPFPEAPTQAMDAQV